MRKFFIPTLLGLSMLVATPALADWDGAQRLNVPQDQWLAPAEIADKLSAQGYKVDEIEADDGAQAAHQRASMLFGSKVLSMRGRKSGAPVSAGAHS